MPTAITPSTPLTSRGGSGGEMPAQIVYDRRYQGPFGNVNGGYLAGPS